MSKYLLSTYAEAGSASAPPPGGMQEFMKHVVDLEEEMDEAGVFYFGGGLTGPESAAVVDAGRTLVTDGPFAESKEHIAGFYIVEVEEYEDALRWAQKVSKTLGSRIEVRRFAASGRAKDMLALGN